MMASTLNPKAQPWQPSQDEDQKASLLKLAHDTAFHSEPMQQPKQQNVVALLPPQLLIGSPSTMQQKHNVNSQHFWHYGLTCCWVCSYDARLQPKAYHFHPSGCDRKRVVIGEMKSDDGDAAEETQAAEKGEGLDKVCAGENMMVMERETNGSSHGGQKRVLRRRILPPRLMKSKTRHPFRNFEKKMEIKQIWRPINARSNDGLVANNHSSSSPPLLPPSETAPSLPNSQHYLLCQNTTVMIKNIPNMFRRNTLIVFLDECCRAYQMEYDFLYLPMDFRTLDNLGYAFVNFTTIPAAMKFKDALQNYEWGGVYGPYGVVSRKVCEITWARIQGKDALVEHFEKSEFACKTMDYLPVVVSPARDGSNSTALHVIGKLCTKPISPRRPRN